jgi:hypothetical protein
VTIQVRFHQLSHDDVEQDEHAQAAQRQRPSWIDGQGKDGSKERGHRHTDIGNEAHHTCQNSAKQGLREAQHAQAHPDGQPEREVDRELRNKIPGESVAGVVKRKSGCAYVGRAGDEDEAVAQ